MSIRVHIPQNLVYPSSLKRELLKDVQTLYPKFIHFLQNNGLLLRVYSGDKANTAMNEMYSPDAMMLKLCVLCGKVNAFFFSSSV